MRGGVEVRPEAASALHGVPTASLGLQLMATIPENKMFKIGQRVLCIASGPFWMKVNGYTWWQRQRFILTGKRPASDVYPRYSEVLEISYIDGSDSIVMLAFHEYPGNVYSANAFRPLLDADLEKQVNELEEDVAVSQRLRESLFSKEKVINR